MAKFKLNHGTVQVAGFKSREEVYVLLDCQVDLIGLPLFLDHHKPDLSLEQAKEIIETIAKPDKFVLITYLKSAQDIFNICTQLKIKIIQIHGDIDLVEVKKLKSFDEDLYLIKSLIVKGTQNLNNLLQQIDSHKNLFDCFIIDTFDPKTGASGATGKVQDWNVSQKLVQHSPKPVILAGGLTPQNVALGIEVVKPFAVDVHTGVEDKTGIKTATLVQSFVEQAREAFGKSR